jgi:hypothetical protein
MKKSDIDTLEMISSVLKEHLPEKYAVLYLKYERILERLKKEKAKALENGCASITNWRNANAETNKQRQSVYLREYQKRKNEEAIIKISFIREKILAHGSEFDISTLASDSGVSERTIKKILNNKPVGWVSVSKVEKTLGITRADYWK